MEKKSNTKKKREDRQGMKQRREIGNSEGNTDFLGIPHKRNKPRKNL